MIAKVVISFGKKCFERKPGSGRNRMLSISLLPISLIYLLSFVRTARR